ncbi:hypothetical protein BMF89_19090 [Arthrobacter sp. SRS-W-1-2016]|uniref:hypothetical protein n=1 Tax=Arthrobacter sp. SRS-W-1-2016 TaxID=1930254 RepID=UPI000990DD23|nr:hypothetical protein [Arthrobacter sp. SRS-W-1-2016]OOP59975.1 hypothetical protein BMF89_19090 [Arthrobacter sp. SRS-W-1-2016]
MSIRRIIHKLHLCEGYNCDWYASRADRTERRRGRLSAKALKPDGGPHLSVWTAVEMSLGFASLEA